MVKRYPKFSIITACYNSEKFIESALNSVVHQSYHNIEYIVVDGASKDGTMEIIQKYKGSIAKLISEPDNGAVYAYNKGIEAASGDVIFFLNSDDYLYNETVIERVADVFADKPDLLIGQGDVECIDETVGLSYVIGRKYSLDDLKRGMFPSLLGLFIKKELYVKHGPFSVKYRIANDMDFVYKCLKTDYDKYIYIHMPITVFRQGGISSQLRTQQLVREETSQILKDHFGVELKWQDCFVTNSSYYKAWVELLLLYNKAASDALKREVKRVALFGSLKNALYVLEDLRRNSIEVVVFLDNNANMQGKELRGIKIHHPHWLKSNHKLIDAIILTFENNYDNEVRRQVDNIIPGNQIRIFSWRDLIEMSCG